jgi:signal transduction histidine kinase
MPKILRYKLPILLFIVAWLPVNDVHSQKIDSLRMELGKAKKPSEKSVLLAALSFAMTTTKPDSAILLAKQGEEIAKGLKDNELLAECLASLGWAYFKRGKNDSAVIHLEEAIKLFHNVKNYSREGRAMVNLASILNLESKDEKALSYLMEARKLFTNEKDELTIAYTDKTIASIFRHQGEFKKAKQYLFEALATFEKQNHLQYKSDTYGSIGSVYWEEKSIDSALYYYHLANQINILLKNKSNTAFSSENLGDAFVEKSQQQQLHPWIDSAYYYYNIARDIFASFGDEQDVKYEEFKIGRVYRFMNQNEKAEKYLRGALQYFDSAKLYVDAYDACNELGVIFKNTGNYKMAYTFLDKSLTYKDSINNRNRADLIAKMLAQYETEKSDKSLQLVDAQKKIDKEELTRTIVIEFFSLGFIILIGLLAMTLWNRNILKHQLKEVETRNQLASDLHDDVGSTLSSILLLSDIASKNKDEELNTKILNRISSNAKEVIERMSDIVWTMNPNNDKGDNLKDRIENYVLQIKQFSEFNIQFNISEEIGEINWPMDMRKNVFLICKEAINNSLKYAKANNLSVTLLADAKKVILEIKDDGIGFDKNNNNAGNGLKTMVNRAESMNGTCSITAAEGAGTLVKVEFPIPRSRYS